MRIHIFADQDPSATGVFYKAFGGAIAQACALRRKCPKPGIKYTFLNLGEIEHHPEGTARKIAGQLSADDLAVIVWDIEDRATEQTLRQLADLERELARTAAGDRAFCLLIKPLTEVVYLLDDPMLETFLLWDRSRRERLSRQADGKRDRRRTSLPAPGEADVHQLASRRRRHARSEHAELPGKAEVLRVLRVEDHEKRRLADVMASCVADPGYLPPVRRSIAVLDKCLDWIERLVTGVHRTPMVGADTALIFGFWSTNGDPATVTSLPDGADSLAHAVSGGTHTILLAHRETKLVGFVLLDLARASVVAVVVSVEERRRGVGRILIEGAEDVFARQGRRQIEALGGRGSPGEADAFFVHLGWGLASATDGGRRKYERSLAL